MLPRTVPHNLPTLRLAPRTLPDPTLSAVQRKRYGSEQAVAMGPNICRYKLCEQPRTVLAKQGNRRLVCAGHCTKMRRCCLYVRKSRSIERDQQLFSPCLRPHTIDIWCPPLQTLKRRLSIQKLNTNTIQENKHANGHIKYAQIVGTDTCDYTVFPCDLPCQICT